MPDCWLANFSKAECEGRMDRCHLIPKQRLRIRHVEDVWERATWVWGCRRHHTLFDHKFLHLKREDLPEETELWAQANRFEWSLTRDYGPLPEGEEA